MLKIDDKTKLFNFRELYEIFEENHKDYISKYKDPEFDRKAKELDKSFKTIEKQITLIEDIIKSNNKKKKLIREKSQNKTKLDDFLKLEEKIKALKTKKKELEENIKEYSTLIADLTNEKQEFERILKQLDGKKSVISYLSELNKAGLKLNANNLNVDEIEIQLENANREKIKIENECNKTLKELNELKKENQKIMDEIAKHSIYFEEGAKKFNIPIDKIQNYILNHNNKLIKLEQKINILEKRLTQFKMDLLKLRENKKLKSETNKKILTEYFDHLFKTIYDNESFYSFVFNEYSNIIRFDIEKRSIIFKRKDGFEEEKTLDDFSSGEKTYAYCRSIILMTQNLAKYPIVILDESYALLDLEHSNDLYKFQNSMIQQEKIAKFINILPFKDNLDLNIKTLEHIQNAAKMMNNLNLLNGISQNIDKIQRYKQELDNYGYFQVSALSDNIKLNPIFSQIGDLDIAPDEPPLNDADFNEEIIGPTIVLDASNIARNNTSSKWANLQDVIRMRKKLIKEYNFPKKNIFIIFGAGLRHYLKDLDKEEFERLMREPNILQAPSHSNDDWFIIKFAFDNKSYIISNDTYREFKDKYPQFKEFLKDHRFGFMVLRNHVSFDEKFENILKNLKFEK
ncbi:MAG: NYN domain-containing protein [Promethearchaeota archaeon]